MKVDLIVKNGKLFSVDKTGAEHRGEAIAVRDGIIVKIGSNDEILKYADSNTEIIDAKGATVLPGLSDAHVHASFSASGLFSANLFGSDGASNEETIENIKNRMVKYIAEHPDDEIIRGAGWNSGILSGDCLPSRHDLDAICPDKPVVLESFCQHFIWVNTKALELAGIDEKTPTPRTGRVFREADGFPAGIFGEFTGIHLLRDALGCDYSVDEYKYTLRIYQKELANKYGVTAIFDAYCSENAREAYKQMAKDEELTIRVVGNYYADPSKGSAQFDDMIARKARQEDDINDLYCVNTVKFFMEGSGDGFFLTEPFEEAYRQVSSGDKDPTQNGFWTDKEVCEYFLKLNEAGLQIHTHAMGDGAVKQSIDGFEYAYKKTGQDARNTIAHLMLVRQEDIERMAENKVIACVQPTWMVQEPITGPGITYMMGRERYLDMYPYKRFIDAGCVTAAGTDYPVTPPPDPYISMQHAVTRSICEGCYFVGDGSYFGLKLGPYDCPDRDCVSLKEVIQSLTIGAAYQMFKEDVTGSLEVGKSAEIVILNKDLESLPEEEIYTAKPVKTIFKGKVVYEE